jgi:shikimate dehydrogenase
MKLFAPIQHFNPEGEALFGLIGKPLGHSFSAYYFSSLFQQIEFKGKYRQFELAQVADVRELLTRNPQLSGFNVTIPYKESILPFLSENDAIVESVRACNTVIVSDNGALKGFNTDVLGFQHSLLDFLRGNSCPPALILGTGGSAKAVHYVLQAEFNQSDICFVSRSDFVAHAAISKIHAQHCISYDQIDAKLLDHYLLIINCTPVGMYPNVEAAPQLPYHLLSDQHLLFDLVYNPETTAFLAHGQAQGARTMNGLAMLYSQAEHAWKLFYRAWNNRMPI